MPLCPLCVRLVLPPAVTAESKQCEEAQYLEQTVYHRDTICDSFPTASSCTRQDVFALLSQLNAARLHHRRLLKALEQCGSDNGWIAAGEHVPS